MTAYLLSNWVGAGTEENAIRPAIADAFALTTWRDVSGQAAAAGRLNARPSPNIAVIEVQVMPAVAAQIAADATWAPRVLWHDAGNRDPDNTPAGGERTGLRARLRADGVTMAQATAVFDAIPAGASRRQIAEALRAWLRDRPGA